MFRATAFTLPFEVAVGDRDFLAASGDAQRSVDDAVMRRTRDLSVRVVRDNPEWRLGSALVDGWATQVVSHTNVRA